MAGLPPTQDPATAATAAPIADPETDAVLNNMWSSSMEHIRNIDPRK